MFWLFVKLGGNFKKKCPDENKSGSAEKERKPKYLPKQKQKQIRNFDIRVKRLFTSFK